MASPQDPALKEVAGRACRCGQDGASRVRVTPWAACTVAWMDVELVYLCVCATRANAGEVIPAREK